MGLTNYPFGITSFGVPVLGSAGSIPATSGSYFWVDSAVGDNGTGAFDSPVKTLAAAYALCTTAKGDVIVMKVGHAETIATNTALTLNKSGVSVVGLGNGALRPTITLTGTTAAVTITVSGANQLFRNFIVSTGRDELVSAWTISGTDVTLDGVDWVEASVSYQAIAGITTTAAADRLTIKNCRMVQVTAPAGNGPAISLVGADDCFIADNYIDWLSTNNAASGGIIGVTTESLRMVIVRNFVSAQGGSSCLGIAPLASSTGVVAFNGVTCPNGAGSVVGRAGMLLMENYAGTSGTTSAILDPTAGV
jgi:hypothetical protein